MPVSVAVNGLSHYRDRYNPTGPSNPPHFAQLRVQNRHDRLKGWRLGMHILRFSLKQELLKWKSRQKMHWRNKSNQLWCAWVNLAFVPFWLKMCLSCEISNPTLPGFPLRFEILQIDTSWVGGVVSDTMPVSVAVNGLSHYRDRYNPTGPSNPPHFAQLRVQNRHDRLKGWRLGMHILRFSRL